MVPLRIEMVKKDSELKDSIDILNTNLSDIKSFYRRKVDLRSLSESYYYPVVGSIIPRSGMHRLKLNVELNSGTKPSWSTHSAGYSCTLDILEQNCGWGTTSGRGIVLQNDYSYSTSMPVSYTQMTNSGLPVFYCGGGGVYTLYTLIMKITGRLRHQLIHIVNNQYLLQLHFQHYK